MTTKVTSCSHGAECPQEMHVKGASLLQIQANWMVNTKETRTEQYGRQTKRDYWTRVLISVHQWFSHRKKNITGTMEGIAI